MTTVRRRIQTSDTGGVCVVGFQDRKILDAAAIQELGDELASLVEQDGHKRVLLDFTNVDFLSSAALNKLIVLDRKAKAASGVIKLCNLKPELREVFVITRLIQLFDIRDSKDDALKAFQ
jgi:anti-sigma B factor antagonist